MHRVIRQGYAVHQTLHLYNFLFFIVSPKRDEDLARISFSPQAGAVAPALILF